MLYSYLHMKLRLFIGVVSLQVLLIIGILGIIIHKKNTLGVSVNSLISAYINKETNGGLTHFYEPMANSNEEVNKEWLAHKVIYTINKDALNEKHDYLIKKPSGVFRIITLGDSFTFGKNVNTQDNYSERLEDMLNGQCPTKFEVINLGVAGYDIEYMRERYVKRGKNYSPDLVVALFGDFQLYRLRGELGKRVDEIKKKTPQIDESDAFVEANRMIIYEYGWERILKWQEVQIARLIQSINQKMVIMKFPVADSWKDYFWTNEPYNPLVFRKYNELFKKESERNNNIHFFNFNWSTSYNLPDGHPNEEGHKALAKYVFDYIVKEGLISCDIQN